MGWFTKKKKGETTDEEPMMQISAEADETEADALQAKEETPEDPAEEGVLHKIKRRTYEDA